MNRSKKQPVQKVDYGEILDVFLWGMGKLMRPTLSNMLAGFEEYQYYHRRDALIQRLHREQLISRTGQGTEAVFILTDKGRQRLGDQDPTPRWERRWDGIWRVVTFDLPEVQRKDRKRLWRALRAHGLGLLQRSVWIWPDELEPILNQIVHAEGVPECFCGFESRRVFLCTDQEIVASAWDWEEIGRRQEAYLRTVKASLRILENASDLQRLAAEARSEKIAYDHAMIFDPLLPRALWPAGYRGAEAWEWHKRFRNRLRRACAGLQSAALPAPVNQRNDRSSDSPVRGAVGRGRAKA